MKKFFSILLCACLLLSITACGNVAESEPSETGNSKSESVQPDTSVQPDESVQTEVEPEQASNETEAEQSADEG